MSLLPEPLVLCLKLLPQWKWPLGLFDFPSPFLRQRVVEPSGGLAQPGPPVWFFGCLAFKPVWLNLAGANDMRGGSHRISRKSCVFYPRGFPPLSIHSTCIYVLATTSPPRGQPLRHGLRPDTGLRGRQAVHSHGARRAGWCRRGRLAHHPYHGFEPRKCHLASLSWPIARACQFS